MSHKLYIEYLDHKCHELNALTHLVRYEIGYYLETFLNNLQLKFPTNKYFSHDLSHEDVNYLVSMIKDHIADILHPHTMTLCINHTHSYLLLEHINVGFKYDCMGLLSSVVIRFADHLRGLYPLNIVYRFNVSQNRNNNVSINNISW